MWLVVETTTMNLFLREAIPLFLILAFIFAHRTFEAGAAIERGIRLERAPPGAAVQELDLAEFLSMRQRGDTLIIDARSAQAFQNGHIPKAINFTDVVELLATISRTKASNVVLYCADANCPSAQQVAIEVRKNNPFAVFVYRGGFAEWQAGALEIEKQ